MLARSLSILSLLATAAGCQTTSTTTNYHCPPVEPEHEFEAVTASALVFDPPVAQDEPRLELSRANRQPGVSVGYDELTAEYYSVRLDDRQIGNGFGGRGFGRFGGGGSFDRYERRAVSEKVGIRYR